MKIDANDLIGEEVIHEEFGAGLITSIKKSGVMVFVSVSFDDKMFFDCKPVTHFSYSLEILFFSLRVHYIK